MFISTSVFSGLKWANKSPKESAHSEGQGGHSHHHHTNHLADSNFSASFSFPGGTVKENENVLLNIHIFDSNGNLVKHFKMGHDKLMHLIVVSKDLSYFNHIHPDFDGEGNFTVDILFPFGGEYKVIADFVPEAGSSTSISHWVKVEGEVNIHETVQADKRLMKVVEGKEVELTLSSLNAEEEVTLTFNLTDAKTKEKISNLEPYMGTVGHVVILSKDAETYLHVHPTNENGTGPEAIFMTSFPKSGLYKVWGQFQHQGSVITVPFVINIK
ncbi:hypothetical protein [Paenibacillus sp. FSL K6-2862]|uniref:hypothetical protein n=1 Tax=Paenibacillus sp. FSL K6-2862 TaxID=2921484 RepID=UPI0030F8142E